MMMIAVVIVVAMIIVVIIIIIIVVVVIIIVVVLIVVVDGWIDGRMDMDGRLSGRTDCGRLRRCCLATAYTHTPDKACLFLA
jgi:hypothetical protein